MKTFDRKIILRKISAVEQQIVHLQKQQEKARSTLLTLKKNLASIDNNRTREQEDTSEAADSTSTILTPDEKVDLFLHLFQGRKKDVPARRSGERPPGELVEPEPLRVGEAVVWELCLRILIRVVQMHIHKKRS